MPSYHPLLRNKNTTSLARQSEERVKKGIQTLQMLNNIIKILS